MAITENWNIRSRAHACAHTGNPFTQGESFYTALFDDPATGDLIRRDFSLAAWDDARALAEPFSFWKSTYEPPVSDAKPEVVEKENAESLLRRLIEENSPGSENTRYILAVMLERKKILKHTATRDSDDASFLIYEHPKSGEIYIIRDPELKLDQVEAVQREVSLLLTLGARRRIPQRRHEQAVQLRERCKFSHVRVSQPQQCSGLCRELLSFLLRSRLEDDAVLCRADGDRLGL